MLRIETVEVTPFAQNCRVVWTSSGKEAVVIDPGGDVELIEDVLKQNGLSCKEIWLTHSHLDHCGAVAALKERTGAILLGQQIEAPLRAKVEQICQMYGVPPGLMQNCPEPEKYIDQGDELSIGSEKFQVFFTPGHSPGHLVFYHSGEKVLLAGDTLFAGSIGRTDLPGGDHQQLINSIREKILTLPPETRVLSGHGPDTTVGEEAENNPFLVTFHEG